MYTCIHAYTTLQRYMGRFAVKLSLCFNRAPRHEVVLEEWRYGSTHSLTSALDGGEWSASRPGRFTPREGAPGTHWIGDCVGPRAVLVRRKIPSPRRESKPRTPIVQPVAQRYTDWAITALMCSKVPNHIFVYLPLRIKWHNDFGRDVEGCSHGPFPGLFQELSRRI
jgi:hypothetical protein